MSVGAILVMVGIVAVAFATLYALNNPDEVLGIFQDKPNVKFFGNPTIAETKIPVNFSTVITVTARNYDEETFSNIEARISVEGNNWQEHLDFQQVVKLSETLEPGKTTNVVHIPITAKKLSGTETPFVIKLELFVNGKKTDEKEFGLKIK